jgi:hypothetical protein
LSLEQAAFEGGGHVWPVLGVHRGHFARTIRELSVLPSKPRMRNQIKAETSHRETSKHRRAPTPDRVNRDRASYPPSDGDANATETEDLFFPER